MVAGGAAQGFGGHMAGKAMGAAFAAGKQGG